MSFEDEHRILLKQFIDRINELEKKNMSCIKKES